jgi:signal transduction histidine kinase
MSQLKSDFVSFVSHDLRTPLASIRMFAELLREKEGKLERSDLDYVRIIEGEADRLARMVTNVLDVAKIESGEGGYRPVDMDLRTAVRDAVGAMAYELRKHEVRTELELGPAPVMVHADPVAVGQAVMNLVGNAVKYAAEGGFVGITLRREGAFATVTVADKGPGIRPEVLPRIFEKFFREEESAGRRQGIGLGLPLVKHIMTVHCGEVRVMSEPGTGSAFVLRFPLPDPGSPAHQSRQER